MSDDEELWERIEESFELRVAARALFDAARIAHGHACAELSAATDAMAVSVERATVAMDHAERAGVMLMNAIRLMEMRGAA